MRKRRVLALLLALSLVVSGNGMTVLAEEQGADMPVLASQEEMAETDDKSQEGDSSDISEGTGNPAGEDTSKDTSNEESKTGGDETPENPGTPVNPGENDPSVPKEDDGEQGGDQISTEDGEDGKQDEEPGTEEEPAVDGQEPSVSENDVDETEKPEEELEKKTGVVRMMSFTDDAGLRITFDANAAEANAEKVTITDGVLTGIDASVEGVVDLREKTEIVKIGENAFKGNTNITYVMLPNTVETLESGAFQECTKLKGISIPSRLKNVGSSAFTGCTALTQVALPNSVESIGSSAFKGDSRLFMVHMRSAAYSRLNTIGDSAFEGCSALEMFCSDEEYDLPDSLVTIGDNAFKDCVRIDEVDMGDGITQLGSGAYQGCTGIEKVDISKGLAKVSQYAFKDCTNLMEIEFSTGDPKLTIEANSFENCRKLASVDFSQKVSKIETNAFLGCTALLRIYVKKDDAELQSNAFPDANKGLCIMGSDCECTAYDYAINRGIRYIPVDDEARTDYYTYTLNLTGPTGTTDDPIKVNVIRDDDSKATDINDITNSGVVEPYKKGVKAGTECRVLISWGKGNRWKNSIRLVPGSLKYNGKEISYDGGRYHFKMPRGGAAVTAEFENISVDDSILGNKDTIEGRLSSDIDYDYARKTAYMKVGQSAKFYLTNNYSGTAVRIPNSKIKYQIAPNSRKDVASVDEEGTVKALKEGTTIVRATVEVKNGAAVLVDMNIEVEKTGINHISVLLPDTDRHLIVEKDDKGISGISVPSTVLTTVAANNYDFDIEAAAFVSEEDDEEMEVAFTWTSSDTSVAKVKKASTPATDSENEIIIPRGADGEATITVSATGGDKKKVSRKFVVSVQNYTPRLDATKLTVNPNQTDSTARLGIIDAYGKEIAANQTIEAFEDKENGRKISEFKFEQIGTKTGPVTTYQVSASAGMQEKTYKVRLKVKVQDIIEPFELPLTIVVKKSFPKPTVSFDKKAPKINLFLANDGTEIKPVIGKLGENDVISECWLEPLTEEGNTNYDYDKRFTENFKIEKKGSDWVITQKSDNLLNNKSGKPVLTGYLVMRFEGYDSRQTQKYKITIPTQTVAPSYVLDRTSDTFGTGFTTNQVVTLQLLDKKTKKPIAWEEGFSDTESIIDTDKTTFDFAEAKLTPVEQTVDGKKQTCVGIQVTVPANPMNKTGKLVLKVRNSKWAKDKNFTYTYNIKVDTRPQAYSLKKATVTLNANCPERVETFEMVSNHRDEVISGTQNFEPQSTARTEMDYNKLSVTCQNGQGRISLKDLQGRDAGIKPGNYRYVYDYMNTEGKSQKVTLTVKVTRTAPAVTLKGTNAFNLAAKDGDSYVETSEMILTVKNLPDNPKYLETEAPANPKQSGAGDNANVTDGTTDSEIPGKKLNEEFYRLDVQATVDSIKITTKKYEDLNSNLGEYFGFQWIEDENGAGGKFKISLKQRMDTTTYNLQMTPTFSNKKDGKTNVITTVNPVGFKIKVYNSTINSVKFKAKGKINLLDRRFAETQSEGFAYTEKNGILYTPTVANLNDTLKKVVLFDDYVHLGDYAEESKHSKLFEAHITEDKKSFYLVPKDDAELNNGKTYKVYVWLLMEHYKFGATMGDGIYSAPIQVRTAEILPKVKTDLTTANLFMSSRDYEATFIVQRADDKAVGTIEGIEFGEKDEKAIESFEITSEKQENGSLKVHLKLKKGVSYKCNSTNKIKMYIKFKGQGTNTAGTPITMSVKINK